METIVVPVRYPLTERSRRTLREGRRLAKDRDGQLIVLHINLYQKSHRTTPSDLKSAIEDEFGYMPRTRYAVRDGFILEETLTQEVLAENPDVVVVGASRGGIIGWLRHYILSEPNLLAHLEQNLDCEIVTVT